MMLQRLSFSFLFSFMVLVSLAQSRNSVFEKETKITWLGLDLTSAKLIGDRERLGSESDMRHLFVAWNQIFLDEPEKFNISKRINKTVVNNEIQVTKDNNELLDPLSMYAETRDKTSGLQPADINSIVLNYDFQGLSGIGLMFNIETFSKPDNQAVVWITFVNMDTKEVLLTERMTGEPGGSGLRNFWANALADVLRKMEKKEFEMWRKKYAAN